MTWQDLYGGLATRGREFLQLRELLDERFDIDRSIAPTRSAPMTRLLTVDDVAQRLGVTKDWVWAQARSGRIPHVQLGRYRRFREEAIEQWLEDLEREGVRSGGRNVRTSPSLPDVSPRVPSIVMTDVGVI